MTPVAWNQGTWLNPPERVEQEKDDLLVTAREKSDFWRTTAYGFVHDDGHALLVPFPNESAVEVSFIVDFAEQFDQAGVMVRVSPEVWLKAGVEFCDGLPQVGAVATNVRSDWSQAPVPDWAGREASVRVSRSGDALSVRARCGDEPWSLIRLTPLAPDAEAQAGPALCGPSRAGLTVRFTRFEIGPADPALH
jgi:uncharacterized protein